MRLKSRLEDTARLLDAARGSLVEILPLEDFFAFPGLRLMHALQ
jgi:hypothetical protein